MIAKIQRIPTSVGGEKRLLVYDENRTFQGQIDATPQLINELLGDKRKGYFEVQLDESGGVGEVVIGRRVEDQPW